MSALLISPLSFFGVMATPLSQSRSGVLLEQRIQVVFAKAQELGAVLLTRDQEFGDIRRFPPNSHLGVIVLKMKYQEAASVHSVLQKLLL